MILLLFLIETKNNCSVICTEQPNRYPLYIEKIH